MNTTNYIVSPEDLLLATEIASKVASVLTVVLLGFILFGALLGFRRGLLRQGFHLGVTLAVAAVAFFSISGLCGGIATSFSELTAEELMGYIELQLASQGQSMPPEVYERILPIAENVDFTGVGLALALVINTILAPVLLLLIFLILRLLAKLIANVIGWFIPRGRKPVQKLLGALAGAVEGAVVAGIIILPIVMALNVTGNVVGVVVDNTPSKDEINGEYAEHMYESIDMVNEFVHIYEEISAPLSESFAVKTVSSLGGEAILKSFATIEFDGAKVDLHEELTNVLRLAYKVVTLDTGVLYPADGFSDGEKAYISGIIDEVDNSTVVSNVLYSALRSYVSIGMSPSYEEVLEEQPFVAVIFDLINNKTNASTIADNLNTVKNILFILVDNGFGGDFTGDFYEILLTKDESGETLLTKVVAELGKNPNTAHLPDALVGAVMSQMGMGESVEYEAVKDSFGQIVQIETEGKEKEEVKEEVKDTFVDLLEDFDVVVGEEGDVKEEDLDVVVDFFTEELMNGNLDIPVDVNGQISDADLMELIIKYQKYFEENGNGSESDSNDGGNEENITEIIPDQE